ncbi:MAG: hypothetical protein GX913_03190 [Clostridiales bacterium]|nr:hypothetical protein [Clostridiales bacterium]
MKKAVRILAITLIVAFGVVYFAFIADRGTEPKPAIMETNDEVSKLIVRNLDTDYPNSPREVARFYSRIMQSYYALDYTEEELIKLVSQSRILFDPELLEENPEEDYITNLKAEIKSFEEKEQIITNYKVDEVGEIEYYSAEGIEYAEVSVEYSLKNKDGLSKVYEDYMMRKDEEGSWKILGWKLTPESVIEND